MKRQLILIVLLLLLLIPVGIIIAQSSANFRSTQSVQMSGGRSSSANYSAHMVIGQPLTERSQSTNFVVNSGFLPASTAALTSSDTTVFLPLIISQ